MCACAAPCRQQTLLHACDQGGGRVHQRCINCRGVGARTERTNVHPLHPVHAFSSRSHVSSLLLRKESAIVTFSAAVTVLCRRRRKQLKYDRTARQHHLASPQHSSRLPSKAIRKLNCFLQSLSQIACFRQCPHKIHFQSITQEYNLMI